MNVRHSKMIFGSYVECGDAAISRSDYLTALSAYSIAFGILITIDAPHELKFVADNSATLRDKLQDAKDQFHRLWESTLAGS